MQKEKAWLLSSSLSAYRSDRYWDEEGRTQPQPAYHKSELGLYAEYGASTSRTYGASAQIQRLSQEDAAGSQQAFGLADPEFFIRQSVYDEGHWALSVQPLIKLPGLQQSDAIPRSGSRSTDLELSVLGGHSFEWLGKWHYAEARLGYRSRHGHGARAQWVGDARLGIRLAPRWISETTLSARMAASSPGTTAIFSEAGEQNYDLIKSELMLIYEASEQRHWMAGIFSHLSGRNTGSGHGLTIGTRLRF